MQRGEEANTEPLVQFSSFQALANESKSAMTHGSHLGNSLPWDLAHNSDFVLFDFLFDQGLDGHRIASSPEGTC